MLDYYLPNGAGDGSLLGQLIAPLSAWAERSGAGDPRFMTAVLFGGILGSLYSILQFICAPLWGAYSDRVGRRKVLLITIAGLALSYAAWFFAASFWVLVLARVLGGAMGGNLSVATAAVADSTTREKALQRTGDYRHRIWPRLYRRPWDRRFVCPDQPTGDRPVVGAVRRQPILRACISELRAGTHESDLGCA